MKVLIDTNIILDVATRRESLWGASQSVLELCRQGVLTGCVSTRTFLDMFYILRKEFSSEVRKQMIKTTRNYLETVIITNDVINTALENNDFSDFEDSVQNACAIAAGADYIVTRNIKDYAKSSVKAILPEELLSLINQTSP